MTTNERPCTAGCGRPTSLFLCRICAEHLARDLGDVPALLAELDTTVARQHQFGGGIAGNERPLVFGWHAADVLWSLSNVAGTWARALAEDRGLGLDLRDQSITARPRHARHYEVATVRTVVEYRDAVDDAGQPVRQRVERTERLFHDDPAVVQGVQRVDITTFGALAARWLLRHSEAVRMSPAAGELVDEVRDAVRLARKAIDRQPMMLAAGPCGAELPDGEGGCEVKLYVLADLGQTMVICPACGTEHPMDGRLDWMLDEAQEQEVTGTVAIAWILMLLGKAIPRGTLRSWASRDQLKARNVNTAGHPLYRFGDVRDLAVEYIARNTKPA